MKRRRRSGLCPDDTLKIVARGADKGQGSSMKFQEARPFADPPAAVASCLRSPPFRARAAGPDLYRELINYPMLFRDKASPVECGAGLAYAVETGWLGAARIRNVREVHAIRCQPVRITYPFLTLSLPRRSRCRWQAP
jgi:hypothetical protein